MKFLITLLFTLNAYSSVIIRDQSISLNLGAGLTQSGNFGEYANTGMLLRTDFSYYFPTMNSHGFTLALTSSSFGEGAEELHPAFFENSEKVWSHMSVGIGYAYCHDLTLKSALKYNVVMAFGSTSIRNDEYAVIGKDAYAIEQKITYEKTFMTIKDQYASQRYNIGVSVFNQWFPSMVINDEKVDGLNTGLLVSFSTDLFSILVAQ
jgi:hypothetical protein